jgi:hypothetical protein
MASPPASTASSGSAGGSCEAHGTYKFGAITFCSDFDNGNLRRVEPINSGSGSNQPLCFNIWTAPDNAGSDVESNHCSWYYFSVTGLAKQATLRIVSALLIIVLSHVIAKVMLYLFGFRIAAHHEHEEARGSVSQRHATSV